MLDRGSRFDRNYTGSLPMFPRESYGQVAAIADDERNHNLSVGFWPWGVIFGTDQDHDMPNHHPMNLPPHNVTLVGYLCIPLGWVHWVGDNG